MKEADALQKENPTAAEAIYKSVLELYGDKPWAADRVERWKALEDQNRRD